MSGPYGPFTGIAILFDKTAQVGKVLGINDGTVEAYFDSDGSFKAAGGLIEENRNGLLMYDMTGASITAPTFGVGLIHNVISGNDSNNFAATSWTKTGGTTVTANNAVGPDGWTGNADKIDFAAGGDYIYWGERSVITRPVVFAIWLKAASQITVDLVIYSADTSTVAATKTVTVETTWKRFFVTATTTSPPNNMMHYRIARNTATSVWAWGAQVSYAVTKPIPYFPATVSTLAPIAGTAVVGPLYVRNPDSASILVGNGWSQTPQGERSIYLGEGAGDASTAADVVAVGKAAGNLANSAGLVAVGVQAAQNVSGTEWVAIGYNAGNGDAGDRVVLIGCETGTGGYSDVVVLGTDAEASAANQMAVGSADSPIYEVALGKGGRAVTPTDVTVRPSDGWGSNRNGSVLILGGGRPTGSGTEGTVVIKTAPAGGSGTTVGTYATRMTVSSAGIDVASHRITSVADATTGTDALNRQTGDARYLAVGTTAYLKADGTVIGATSQAQKFTSGLSVGSGTATATDPVFVQRTTTNTAAWNSGLYNQLNVNLGGASSQRYIGFRNIVSNLGGANPYMSGLEFAVSNDAAVAVTEAYGLRGGLGITVASGTITDAVGADIYCYTTQGTITNYKGVAIGNPFGGGAVTNAYGLYIASITGGGTSNYAIYSAGGTSYHAGDISTGGKMGVGVGTAAPATSLDVLSATAATATVNAVLISRWARPQTGGVKYGNSFELLLGSYGTDVSSQSRLDLKMANGYSDTPDTHILTIQADGKLGINTTTPDDSLQVVGNLKVGEDTTNYAEFDTKGFLKLYGTARVWDDLRIEPVARTTGTNAPTFEKWYDDAGGTSRGVYLYSFDDAAAGSEKEVHFTAQMAHNWAQTAIHVHVHWIASHSDTTATPRWGLEYAWVEPGVTFGDTTIVYTTGNEQGDTDLTANRHYITEFSPLTPDSTQDGFSSILVGRLFRNSSNAADTYDVSGNKCGLLYIDIHYEIDKLGSDTEYA